MKKLSVFVCMLVCSAVSWSQDFSSIFTLGLEESNRFAKGYLQAGSESMVYSMHNGWFNSAEAKPLLGFEISFIGNIAMVDDDKHTFSYTPDPAGNLHFSDGSLTKDVATILGEVNPDVEMTLTVTNQTTGLSENIEVVLPESVTGSDVMNVPSGYIQASMGILKGTEVKLRILPGIDINGRRIGLLGGAIQHEFTKWLPADKLWPVAISGMVAYARLDANYDMQDVVDVDGVNQRFVNKTDSWLFQAIVSTKLPVINFYGGIGYITGVSDSYLRGTYEAYQGFGVHVTVKDPIAVTNKISGIRGTIGTRLKLGFFRLNAEYSVADFNTVSAGVSFGFR